MQSPSRSPITGSNRGCFLKGDRHSGFTLVEVLVATVILTLILALVLSITDQTSKIWKHSTSEIQAFQNARAAYGTLTQRLSQATLNTYLDYYASDQTPRTPSNASSFIPTYYARNSNLHFISGQASTLVPGTGNLHPGHAVFFQAPLGFTLTSATYGGLPNMLNACGYYVEYNTDKDYLPPFLSGTTAVQERYRYRLMEFMQPTEANTIYSSASTGTVNQYSQWFRAFMPPTVTVANAPLRVLGENIIALAILPELSPRDSTTKLVDGTYSYDTRAGTILTSTSPLVPNVTHNQLPPLLRVVMVAIDEPSAQHLSVSGTLPPALIRNLTTFKTTANADPNVDLNADLDALTTTLSANKINFRVFDTDIAIRGAKWSTQ